MRRRDKAGEADREAWGLQRYLLHRVFTEDKVAFGRDQRKRGRESYEEICGEQCCRQREQ